MFDRILVPVDGSATSTRGLDEAIRMAKNQKATLCLLHVVDQNAMVIYPEAGAYIATIFDALREGGRKILSESEARARKEQVPFESALMETLGRAVSDVIIGYTKKCKPDVIVMGTHGRRGMNRLVMGSDAEAVVRESRVPVMLMRAPEGRPGRRTAKAPARPAARGAKSVGPRSPDARPAKRGAAPVRAA